MARILVIDDETNIRRMIKLALKHVGHEVETAEDGREGLNLYRDGAGWDLVLLDQRMPGMEGIEVLRQLRHEDARARVIMVTAFGTVDLAVEAMKAGATDFLRKPFTAETLRGAVDAALRTPEPTAIPGGTRPRGITFAMTTINGYRIEFVPASGPEPQGEISSVFSVRSPEGQMQECTVTLPPYVLELVRAHANRETFPGGARFWQALCEEALANYLYQHAEFPPEGRLRVEDLTTSLRRFMEAVLAAG